MFLGPETELHLVPTSTPGKLYLGGWHDYDHNFMLAELRKREVQLVLSIGFSEPPLQNSQQIYRRDFLASLDQLYYDVSDESTEEAAQIMRGILGPACLQIDFALRNGRNVYVHCWAGVSRSPTVVLAYLLERQEYQFEAALEFLRKCRPHIRPNSRFLQLLAERASRSAPAAKPQA